MSTSRLPSFSLPPVTEVLVSAQFEPLPALMAPHFGLIWQRFKPNYPRIEQHPALAPTVERVGVRTPMNAFRVEMMNQIGTRAWFINKDGDQLVQVQSDRFVRNWRALPEANAIYPRWNEHVLPNFLRDLQVFRAALKEEELGAPAINQLEVAYINHIWLDKDWKSHSDLPRIVRWWQAGPETELPIEAVNFQSLHTLLNREGAFLGRLHITLQSGFASSPNDPTEERGAFVINLTARGRPDGEGEAGIKAFLEIGHAAVVTTFDKMTTEEAHQKWQKQP
jgi:uncharacterized protein (TIGR04255 family)